MTPMAAPETIGGLLSAYGHARSTISGAHPKLGVLPITHSYWHACNHLMLALTGEPAVEGAVKNGAHQESVSGALGYESGARVHLYSPEPLHQKVRPGHDLSRVTWTRSTRSARSSLLGRRLFGNSIRIRAKATKVHGHFLSNFTGTFACIIRSAPRSDLQLDIWFSAFRDFPSSVTSCTAVFS